MGRVNRKNEFALLDKKRNNGPILKGPRKEREEMRSRWPRTDKTQKWKGGKPNERSKPTQEKSCEKENGKEPKRNKRPPRAETKKYLERKREGTRGLSQPKVQRVDKTKNDQEERKPKEDNRPKLAIKIPENMKGMKSLRKLNHPWQASIRILKEKPQNNNKQKWKNGGRGIESGNEIGNLNVKNNEQNGE